MIRRYIRMQSGEAFHAYQVGRWTAHRDYWMDQARNGPKHLRALHVSFARNAHREAMKYLKKVATRTVVA